jgi:hypothetical protein
LESRCGVSQTFPVIEITVRMSLPNLKHAEGEQDMNTRFWLQNIYKRGKRKDEDVEVGGKYYTAPQ